MEDFDVFFDKNRPQLEHFEAFRKKQLKKIKETDLILYFITIASIFIIIFIFTGVMGWGVIFFIPIMFGLGSALRTSIVKAHKTEFSRAFRLKIMRGLFTALNPTFKYYPARYVAHGKFDASRLYIDRADKLNGEDYIVGKIGATDIELSEIHALKFKNAISFRRLEAGQGYYKTFFRGLFVIADFHKSFKGRTVVLPDFAERKLGGFGKLIQKLNFSRDELVYFEDVEFENEFAVYSTDQVEARYILSTSMLENIMKLKNKFNTKMRISFFKSKLIVAIETKQDLFEPHLKECLLDRNVLLRFYEEMQLCLGLVEDLNLNTRIWTKQ